MNMNAPTIKTVIDPEDRLNFGPEWLTLPGFMAFEHCLYNCQWSLKSAPLWAPKSAPL